MDSTVMIHTMEKNKLSEQEPFSKYWDKLP